MPLQAYDFKALDVACAGTSGLRRTASVGDLEHLSLAPGDAVSCGPGLGAGGHQLGRAGKKSRPRGQGGPPSGVPVVRPAYPSFSWQSKPVPMHDTYTNSLEQLHLDRGMLAYLQALVFVLVVTAAAEFALQDDLS